MTTQLPANQPDELPAATLRPPTLPNWTTPVVGYDGGLRVAALEGGLFFVINPWFEMSEHDVVRMFCDDSLSSVWEKTLSAEDVNNPVSGTIAEGHIVNGDLYPLYYTVQRLNQEPELSDKLNLLVKLDRPGGFDDDLVTPGHSNLRFTLPQDIIDNGVSPIEAEAGVPITILPYRYMRIRDRVRCVWGSTEIYVLVEQRHIDDPANNPLIVLINKAMIEEAGDSDGVAVAFQVIDEVDNRPDPRSPWSAITHIMVDLKQNRLDAPIVLEADPDTNVIDLDELLDEDVTVLVNTSGGAFKAGNVIAMTWIGTPAEGSTVIHGPIEKQVERVGIQVSFTVPNAKVRAIAKGRASVSYVLKSEGAADRPSKKTSVSVEGDISQLLAPNVLQAAGGHLPADSPFATVSVPYYEGRRAGDLITVHWRGTRPSGGATYVSIRIIVANEREGMPIERNVPAREIALLDGGKLALDYVVANDHVKLTSVRGSLPLKLNVGVAQPELLQPDVIEAPDNVLLPEDAIGGANVIAPFTGTLPGDTVGLRWVGSVTGAHPTYEIPLSSHTAGQPVPFLVQPQYIAPNLNGQVQVSYYVISDNQPIRNSHTRTLRIGATQTQWRKPEVLEAPNDQLDPNVHQTGFIVRVDTKGMLPNDEIELIVEGRPGEGSIRPERRKVEDQLQIDFPIAAPITGANLGRAVDIRYEVVRSSGPEPSDTRVLQVGTLLPLNMPRPLLEGFDGEFLTIGGIKDNSKILCGKWPFQLYGAPVWLDFIETRTDGTSRTKKQLVAEANNRIEGLEIIPDIAWLRECRADSRVEVILKVGLFASATLTDAIACQLKTYSVYAEFYDLSTFTDYNYNGWSSYASNPIRISYGGGEYFVEGASGDKLYITKIFKEMEVGSLIEITFNYIIGPNALVTIYHNTEIIYQKILPHSETWTSLTLTFTVPDVTLTLYLRTLAKMKIDNIRLRKIPRTTSLKDQPKIEN